MRDYERIFNALLEDVKTFCSTSDAASLSEESLGLHGPTFRELSRAPERSHDGPGLDFRRVQVFACRQLLSSFYKKLSPGSELPEGAELRALRKFESINSGISREFRFPDDSPRGSQFWRYFKRNVYDCLTWSDDDRDTNLDVQSIGQWMGIGPGSNRGVNAESFYTKLFDGNLSGTDQNLLALYRAAIVDTGSWADAEKRRSETFGFTSFNGNKLFFVPKNTEVARTCCTEPVLNMLLQKGIGGYIESRLSRYFGISLDLQPDLNRRLARKGSIDGSFGTIDLTSASDSMSWALVQQIVPNHLCGWLAQTRSRFTTLPNGENLELMMISTMGNGFTFPLQTLIFACVVRSVYQQMGFPSFDPSRHLGVFGDDIIVRREAYDEVVLRLTNLGFEVNEGKSFNSGFFRESCGSDWYDGHDVRGVYIKTLETTSDVYSAINRLNRWSAKHGVALTNTITSLMGLCRFRPIPFYEGDHEGVKVPSCVAVKSLKGIREYRKLTSKPRQKRVPLDLPEARSLGYRHFIDDGWITCLLGGYAREKDPGYNARNYQNGNHSVNRDLWLTPRSSGSPGFFFVARCHSLWWDWPGLHPYSPGNLPEGVRMSYRDWEIMIAVNLNICLG
jgi:hypothetical protein